MRFAHIADTHIRNLKYHFEYREVFKQLYESLRNENVDYIIHCGDIAHTKTQISPEFVEMCSDFFRNLANIAPTYIILGNHDGNLKNSSRQDALTPIVEALDLQQLHLLKEAGETPLKDKFTLNVLSVFDEDNWAKPSDYDNINIALYHGAISSCSTDIGWVMEATDHDIDIFSDFDYAFLGDIHKTQILDKEGRVRYAGSTVQQNFGETLDKGYLLWDIESKEQFNCKHIYFDNPKPFITIDLTKSGRLPKKVEVPQGARLRLASSTNISLDKIRKAVDVAKHRYKPESITFLNRAANRNISIEDITKNLLQEDLRDIKVQERLIKEYLKDYQVEDSTMKKVLQLNQRYNSVIEQSEEVSRNINWNLKSMEWDCLFNYGKDNKIDFSKLNGIVGIFGKNFSGKSSIVDSVLYTVYNSTSKSVRKNLNIINQNNDIGVGKVVISINDKDYTVSRVSEKYTKKLHGEETTEAKTDLDFYSEDMLGKKTSLNGLSRQDTDKKIRKMFGTIDDFLMTSMASQLGSLSFINEGSTKRKEILAKFLDLEVFERKFKMAKEDSQETKGLLKKLQGKDYEQEIKDINFELDKSALIIDNNDVKCAALTKELEKMKQSISSIQNDIDSVPEQIIDITQLRNDLLMFEDKKTMINNVNNTLVELIEKDKASYQKIESFVSAFNIKEYFEKQETISDKQSELQKLLNVLKQEGNSLLNNRRKTDLLKEVPCGSEYSHCKFIKDAYAATDLIKVSESTMKDASVTINSLGKDLGALDPTKVQDHINKYNQVLDKKNEVSNRLSSNEISLEKNNNELMKLDLLIKENESKVELYEANREAIENLEGLLNKRNTIKKDKVSKEKELNKCQTETLNLYKQRGSLEQQLETLQEQKHTLEEISTEYSAFDLLMTCCHSNGISYDIIKKRLPLINSEIAKILTNIVEFQVFIENDGKKLDILIQHPKHEARPLELGSGAEKTIASMAMRLALLTVSSLPKPDIFILDEPGTALDEENMEGFTRILDMVKTYFKTVILISHLDVLKDCVDSQIIIEKKDGYAHVNI
jgi:DNA repair exonuclease SbcCD ATPase subunit/DNA repair exonuclease SbcCD nuclease subunit